MHWSVLIFHTSTQRLLLQGKRCRHKRHIVFGQSCRREQVKLNVHVTAIAMYACKDTVNIVSLCCIHEVRQIEAGSKKACTSKPQKWHKPHVQGKQATQPDFVCNLVVKKVRQGRSDTKGEMSPD